MQGMVGIGEWTVMGRDERGWQEEEEEKSKVKNRTLKTAGMRHPKASEHIEGIPPACFPRDVQTFCTRIPGDEKRHRASNDLRVRTDIRGNFRLLAF
jgi:hypothetical protein